MKNRYLWLETVVGLVFVFSGLLNFFGLGEDIHGIVATAAQTLAGTRLSGLANLVNAHWYFVLVPICLAMIVSGACQIWHTHWAKTAAIFQLVLMLGFVTFLHRAFPEIIFADGVLALGLFLLLTHERSARPNAKT